MAKNFNFKAIALLVAYACVPAFGAGPVFAQFSTPYDPDFAEEEEAPVRRLPEKREPDAINVTQLFATIGQIVGEGGVDNCHSAVTENRRHLTIDRQLSHS